MTVPPAVSSQSFEHFSEQYPRIETVSLLLTGAGSYINVTVGGAVSTRNICYTKNTTDRSIIGLYRNGYVSKPNTFILIFIHIVYNF